MNKTFEDFLNESKQRNPELATYIHLCTVLQESSETPHKIRKLFLKHMPEDEYDKEEVDEMVAYLIKIAM